jgi:hypothetical protein
VESVIVAVPEVRVAVPTVVVPSRKVTLPVGVLPPVELTVAVSVTGVDVVTLVVGETESVVVVATGPGLLVVPPPEPPQPVRTIPRVRAAKTGDAIRRRDIFGRAAGCGIFCRPQTYRTPGLPSTRR